MYQHERYEKISLDARIAGQAGRAGCLDACMDRAGISMDAGARISAVFVALSSASAVDGAAVASGGS
jgi:hypothetical protein